MLEVINRLDSALLRLAGILKVFRMKQDILYSKAVSFIGKDASPQDFAPDEYGCMESVSRVLQEAFPDMQFPLILSTREGYDYFRFNHAFKEIAQPVYGCIIISATGSGNGSVSNGHVGIVGKYTSPDNSVWVMSNDSRTGTWEASFTVNSWNRYYKDRGGMATHYFMVV
jgi:hypothetical protein